MYTKQRRIDLIQTFEGLECEICGHPEAQNLVWYPHHKKIRHNLLRFGKRSEEFEDAKKLIEQSIPVCLHCREDRYYALLVGEDKDPRWPMIIIID